jgi:hypothetical protein
MNDESLKLYVASSWRNEYQQVLVQRLREDGHAVYDYKHPWGFDDGFHWSRTPVPSGRHRDEWRFGDFIDALKTDPAQHACYDNDFAAMQQADRCVLLLPCGNSAHLEAGWFMGQNKSVHILGPQLPDQSFEPELMYLIQNRRFDSKMHMAQRRFWTMHETVDDLRRALGRRDPADGRRP